MILYEAAIWLQQRMEVVETIRELEGSDVSFFEHRKQRLDDEMRRMAEDWIRGGREPIPLEVTLVLEAGGEQPVPLVLDEP